MQIKKLKKLDKIVHKLSAKERKRFMEMLQREELGRSKGNQHEGFLRLFFKVIYTYIPQSEPYCHRRFESKSRFIFRTNHQR
jgi:hypothetical protein